eukprot:scaffold270062_cov21-Tisochrysis_lutea.AAC.3
MEWILPECLDRDHWFPYKKPRAMRVPVMEVLDAAADVLLERRGPSRGKQPNCQSKRPSG